MMVWLVWTEARSCSLGASDWWPENATLAADNTRLVTENSHLRALIARLEAAYVVVAFVAGG